MTEKLFLQEKPALALLFIGSAGKTYASLISKTIDSTFSHTLEILTKMEQSELIRFTFEGRTKFVELTEHGKRTEMALRKFRDIILEDPHRSQKDPDLSTENIRDAAIELEQE